jgi:hypothetical protein
MVRPRSIRIRLWLVVAAGWRLTLAPDLPASARPVTVSNPAET